MYQPTQQEVLTRMSQRLESYVKSAPPPDASAPPPGASLLDSAKDIYTFLSTKLSVEEVKTVMAADLKLLQKESEMKIAADKTGMDPRYLGDSPSGAAMIKDYMKTFEEAMDYMVSLMIQVSKFPKPEHRAKLNKAMAHVQAQQKKGQDERRDQTTGG